MKFCKCGKMMRPKGGGVWVCSVCGKEETDKKVGKINKKTSEKEITIIEDKVSGYPETERECPECGNKRAYYQVIQTRSSDEPPTRFYRCTKCGKKWREYK